MRRVKYGVFQNLQKILKIKLKSFSLCQKMQNSSLYTNIKNNLQSNQLREPFPIPQSFPLQNLYFFQQTCTFASRGRPISPNFEVENFEV
jgi:hypothetical protein